MIIILIIETYVTSADINYKTPGVYTMICDVIHTLRIY